MDFFYSNGESVIFRAVAARFMFVGRDPSPHPQGLAQACQRLVLGRVRTAGAALTAAGSTSTPLDPLAARGRQCRSRHDNNQGNPKVRARLLHGIFPAMAFPHVAFNFLTAMLVYGGGVTTFMAELFLLRWHCHGRRRPFLTVVHPHSSRSSSLRRDLFYRRGIPTVCVQPFHGGAFLPRWHPHGSQSTSSWQQFFYPGGIPTVRSQALHGSTFFTPVACPRFAVNLFMASPFYRGGIPTVRSQALRGGTLLTAVASPRFAVNLFNAAPFPPPWHPHGSRLTTAWRHFHAMASPLAPFFYRRGIPAVRSQPLHRRHLFYCGAIPTVRGWGSFVRLVRCC